jgi:hypothetical protein
MDLHNKDSQIVLSVLLLVLFLVGGAMLVTRSHKEVSAPLEATGEDSPVVEAPTGKPSADVSVTPAPSLDSGKALPEGFPKNIPVEVGNIVESYKVVYKTHDNVTQYTVSYTSNSSVSALWTKYSDFLREEGYTVDTTATDKKTGTISGTKSQSTLAAVVSSHDNVSLVQLSLLYR